MKKPPLVPIVALAFAAALTLHAQTPPPTPADPVYELPQYTVTAQRVLPEAEHWRHALTGGFEILSNTGDNETQKFFRDIRQYLHIINAIAPAVRPRTTSPIKLILCGQRGSFSKLTGVRGAPVVASQWNDQVAFVVNLSGDFMIALNSGASDADDDTAYIQNRLYKNYIDLSLEQFEPRMPAWFEHAVRSLFADMKINGRDVTFAEMRDGIWTTIAPTSTILRHTDPQRSSGDTRDLGDEAAKMLAGQGGDFESAAAVALAEAVIPELPLATNDGDPTDDSTEPDPNAPPPSGEDRPIVQRRNPIMRMSVFLNYRPGETKDLPARFSVSTWARQCVIFTHYWLYRRTSTPKDKATFSKFIQASARGPMDEATFKSILGLSYRNMERDLADYLDYTDMTIPAYTFHEDTRPPPFELRDATPAEIGRMKGETMISFGQNDQGYHELITPYLRKKADPALLAALGVYEYNRGSLARARPLLENAATPSARPDACRALAQLRFDEILASSPDDHLLAPSELRAVIDPLLAARQNAEPALDAYLLLANALRISAEPPAKEHAQIVLQGVNRHPADPALTYLAANVMMRGGYDEQARLLVKRGLAQSGQAPEWRAWLEKAAAHYAHPVAPPDATPPPDHKQQ